MEKKEEFKNFVRKNPNLIKYVKTGEASWQKFYEIYDIYGEDDNAWLEYLKKDEVKSEKASTNPTVGDFFNFLKNIDLDSLQETVNSVQRVLGVFGGLSNKSVDTQKEVYKPRPLYKHLEDYPFLEKRS